tara:strand:+ start:1772 stop:2602 length:831 start_codon:yes stop_codon:yes gene_type:complete
MRSCERITGAFRPPDDAPSKANAAWVHDYMIARNSGRNDIWSMYHESLVRFIHAHYPERPPLTWVEIGTAYGMTTNFVLGRLPFVTAHAVDPCRAGFDETDLTSRVLNGHRSRSNLTHAEFSLAWASALVAHQEQQHRACRYYLHRALSVEGAADFPDASVDVLFIDGLHTFDGVMADLVAYWPKLKPRSLLILNDWKASNGCWCRHSSREGACPCAFPGVKRAGCTFLATKGLETQIIEQGPVGLTNAGVVIGMPAANMTPQIRWNTGLCTSVVG